MVKRIGYVVTALFMGTQVSGQTVVEPTLDLVTIRKKALDQEVIVIDVREQQEWSQGHLKVARLIPLSVLQDEEARGQAVANLDKSVPIYCHCKAGIRAKYGADILEQLGFEVTAMTMKYEVIVDAGFEQVNGH